MKAKAYYMNDDSQHYGDHMKAAAKKSGSWSFSGGSELFARADVEKLNVMHL